jgi:GGDEF domain-containing protein
LTHLLSREGFVAEVEPRMKECLSIELPFTMALVSIDDFDELGEKFGAVVAESVICALGSFDSRPFRAFCDKGPLG